jgi:rubrerythrin
MRPKLLHPLRERTHERAERRGHERREPRVIVMEDEPAETAGLTDSCDRAAERVRQAGGPRDSAVYTCSCGYVFSAAVSTTVTCPHCGGDQAW